MQYDESDKVWSTIYEEEEKNIKLLFSILSNSQHGKKLIKLARKKAAYQRKRLEEIVGEGEISYNDTKIIRQISSDNFDKMTYKFTQKIIINRNHKIMDAVLDLAHELTHFIYRPPFNPYDYKFNFQDFISFTIEGPGGEVDAYLSECLILLENFDQKVHHGNFCHNITRRKGILKFYQMGKYLNKFKTKLISHNLHLSSFPYLSEKKPTFYSAVYDYPYPLAALIEYEKILSKACINERNRLLASGGDSNFLRRCQTKKYPN